MSSFMDSHQHLPHSHRMPRALDTVLLGNLQNNRPSSWPQTFFSFGRNGNCLHTHNINARDYLFTVLPHSIISSMKTVTMTLFRDHWKLRPENYAQHKIHIPKLVCMLKQRKMKSLKWKNTFKEIKGQVLERQVIVNTKKIDCELKVDLIRIQFWKLIFGTCYNS